jgi:coiled-coil domain-containing protein 55
MSGLNTTGGHKFGLSLPKPKNSKRPLLSSSAFGGDDEKDGDEEEENNSKLTYRERVNQQLQAKAAASMQKMAEIQAKLEGDNGDKQGADNGGEDDDIYNYDAFATKKQRREEQASTARKAAIQEQGGNKAQYITSLMVTAKTREKEKELVHDRRMIKEREVEDQLYGDKPKFVTSAYKAKLEEDRQFEEAEQEREKEEQEHGGGPGSFIRNMQLQQQGLIATAATAAASGGGGVDTKMHVAAQREERREEDEKEKLRLEQEEEEEKEEEDEEAAEMRERNVQRMAVVKAARGRYFTRKAARAAAGCWNVS